MRGGVKMEKHLRDCVIGHPPGGPHPHNHQHTHIHPPLTHPRTHTHTHTHTHTVSKTDTQTDIQSSWHTLTHTHIHTNTQPESQTQTERTRNPLIVITHMISLCALYAGDFPCTHRGNSLEVPMGILMRWRRPIIMKTNL